MTAKKVILTVLQLASPPGFTSDDGRGIRELCTRAKEAGFAVNAVEEICSRDAFFNCWSAVCERSCDYVQLVLVSSHGRSPAELLLPDEVVDVAAAIGSLRAAARCGTYVFIDACEVDLPQLRHSQSSPLFVMLASPGGEAIGDGRGGVLTKCLAELVGSTPSPALLLTRASDAVRTRFGQRAEIREFGTALTRVEECLPVRDGAEPGAFVMTLLRESLDRSIAPAFVPAFEEVGLKLPEPHATSARLILLAHTLIEGLGDSEARAEMLHEEQSRARTPPLRVARARALHALGWWYWRKSPDKRIKRAASDLEDAIGEIGEDQPALLAQILDTHGLVLRRLHNWGHAVGSLERSRDIKAAEGDRIGEFITIHNLGWTHAGMGDFCKAESVFAEGLAKVEEDLLKPRDGQDGRQLVALLDSRAFLTVGLATMLLIRGASRREYDPLFDPLKKGLLLTTREWGAKGPHGFANMLCKVGKGGVRDFVDAPDHDPREAVWKACAELEREGAGALENVTKALKAEGADLEPIRYLNALAAASFLYFRRAADPARQGLLREVVEVIRSHDRVIDPVESWPWKVGTASQPIDMRGWHRKGQFEELVESIAAPDTVPFPTVTEHFLQVLAWYSAVILAFEGGVDPRNVIDAVVGDTSQGFMLGLKTAFDTAAKVAALARPKSAWGSGLKRFWEQEPWSAGGYGSRDDFVNERTKMAHAGALKQAEVARIIAAHSKVIVAASESLDSMDDVKVMRGEPCGGNDSRLWCAKLENTRGGSFDCGQLLAVNGNGGLYVPHLMKAGPGAGGPMSSLRIDYRALVDGRSESIGLKVER